MSIINSKSICLKFVDELCLDEEIIEKSNELIKINLHLYNVGLNILKESIFYNIVILDDCKKINMFCSRLLLIILSPSFESVKSHLLKLYITFYNLI